MNERIERGYCNPLAPVATYRARFPQQSATSAIQKWLVRVLRAICIKVFWMVVSHSNNFKKESWNGWSIHNSIDMQSYYHHEFNISIILIYNLNKYKICWLSFVMRTRNYFIVTLQREVTVLAQFDQCWLLTHSAKWEM